MKIRLQLVNKDQTHKNNYANIGGANIKVEGARRKIKGQIQFV